VNCDNRGTDCNNLAVCSTDPWVYWPGVFRIVADDEAELVKPNELRTAYLCGECRVKGNSRGTYVIRKSEAEFKLRDYIRRLKAANLAQKPIKQTRPKEKVTPSGCLSLAGAFRKAGM